MIAEFRPFPVVSRGMLADFSALQTAWRRGRDSNPRLASRLFGGWHTCRCRPSKIVGLVREACIASIGWQSLYPPVWDDHRIVDDSHSVFEARPSAAASCSLDVDIAFGKVLGTARRVETPVSS